MFLVMLSDTTRFNLVKRLPNRTGTFTTSKIPGSGGCPNAAIVSEIVLQGTKFNSDTSSGVIKLLWLPVSKKALVVLEFLLFPKVTVAVGKANDSFSP